MKLIVFLILSYLHVQTVKAQDCLVAEYPFSGSAMDNSGNGFNGLVYGPSLTTDRFGSPNEAYEFDGVNDYIDLTSDFDYASRTINLWFNAYSTSFPDSKVIYDSDWTGLAYGETKIRVIENNGVPVLRMSACDGTTINEININTNQWYMVTMTVDSDSIYYYLNSCFFGGAAYTSTSGASDGNPTVPLGTSRIFDRFFHGKIDDLSIYNCVLSKAQIDALYDNYGVTPCCLHETLIPNVFTPNEDEINDLFPDFTGDCVFEKLQILNRWGQLIFTGSTNINWNGENFSGTQVTEGVYFYILSAGNITKSGMVTLCR